MNRESKLWLTGAGVVAIVVLAVIALFGVRRLPEIARLYEPGAPSLSASVAYVDSGREQCARVLDVATAETREVYCADWLWLEGWDSDGNLRVQSAGSDRISVIDPDAGAVLATGSFAGEQPADRGTLHAGSNDGHATLTNRVGDEAIVVLDIEGPRNYGFWNYGLTDDGRYVWVCDSENRLLVVASDGSGEPWLVAGNVPEAKWAG